MKERSFPENLRRAQSRIVRAALFTGLHWVAITGSVRAEILVDERFNYGDGPVTAQAPMTWEHGSGGDAQVTVSAGTLFLTEADTEDVFILLPTGPFSAETSTTLYAAFDVTLHSLPSGEGNYFAHFRGSSSATFRGRLFVLPDPDGDPTAYSLGITNGASAASDAEILTTPLALDSPTRVVIGYEVSQSATQLSLGDAPTGTLPINASDDTSTRTITGFAFRQSLSSGNGIGDLTIDNLVIATSYEEAADLSTSPPPTESPSSSTTVITVTADQTTIHEGDSIALDFQADPPLDNDVRAEVLIETNGSAVLNEDFQIADSITIAGPAAPETIHLTTFDDSAIEEEKVIHLSFSTVDPTIRVSPPELTVRLLDNDRQGMLIHDSFDIHDRPLAGYREWTTHSGVPSSTPIINEAVELSDQSTEDLNTLIPGHPFIETEDIQLFVGFDLTVLETLASDHVGVYFAHMKGPSNQAFRGRIYLQPTNDEGTTFQIGVLNGTTDDPVYHPTSLGLFQPVRIIMSYDVATTHTTLWLDPESNDAVSVTSTAFAAATPIESFALRQIGNGGATGIGRLLVDNLAIGTEFNAVFSELTDLPLLTISTLDTPTLEGDAEPARFIIRRTGDTSQALVVPLQISGTATQVDDYHIFFDPTQVTLEANQSSLTLNAYTLNDDQAEDTETITLTLLPNQGYRLHANPEASVSIQNATPIPPAMLQINHRRISATVPDGPSYIAESSVDLKVWTPIEPPTPLTGGDVTILEASGWDEPMRFFRLRPVPR